MKNFITAIVLLLIFNINFPAFSREVAVSSPDGKFYFYLYEKNGSIWFTVNYQNTPIILESLLGIEGNNNWKDEVSIGKTVESTVDVTWKPVYGERSTVRDHYNQSEIEIIKGNNQNLNIKLIVRAYNEGIAFRYFFHRNENIQITKENTQYSLPKGTKAYFTPTAQAEYSLLPLKNWQGESERPLLLILPQGLYLLLTEAEMVNYSRTKFSLVRNKSNILTGVMHSAVRDKAPYKTPWRVIMAAEKPGQLIENNDLILNLNPPCTITNSQWITPGKVMREMTLSTAGAKAVVDFAVKRNLQYLHFDAGWYGNEYDNESDARTVTLDPERNPISDDLDLTAAIAYAKKHNIKVILYVNRRALERQLDELLPLYKSWGIDGIKFGFVQVGSQKWNTWLHEAVKKCAEYELVVNVHDEYRPTGFSRTFPNLLTQEGILGNEAFPDATHNVTMPFTRFTQGAADYTICYYRQNFDNTENSDTWFLKTTPAHQLAMAVVYYSPLQYIYWYDLPSDSHNEPELEFFDRVPTVWDDTKVIHGEIGKYITIARRSGNDWFVGTMTNNDGRTLNIPLDFLPRGKRFFAHIYEDDPNVNTRTKVGKKRIKVNNKSVISANLQPSGGQAIWIEKR